ncbi:MAG: phosphatidate cytidylyltransferase, partial [Deferribacterota bacterium]|nr:phosphatidate cytidylyltransferase [Deferribacterota bacterium]
AFTLKLFSTNPLQSIFTSIGATLITITYIPLLLSPILPLQIKYTNYLIFTLFVIWASDSSALFFGKYLGKRSLYKIISPKKTVEGLIGSYFGGFIIATIYNDYFTISKKLDFYIITFAIITAGAIGDLVESMFKRSCNVKDSGQVIPGHGGLLDKIDSLLFAVPIIYLYIFFRT